MITQTQNHRGIPLFEENIPCGFPSPTEGYGDKKIDLNEYLITNPPASYCFQVTGDSMIDIGIQEGDLIIVDKSRKPKAGDIVLASLEGEFTLKLLKRLQGEWHLCPANAQYAPIRISSESFQIWGVAQGLARRL